MQKTIINFKTIKITSILAMSFFVGVISTLFFTRQIDNTNSTNNQNQEIINLSSQSNTKFITQPSSVTNLGIRYDVNDISELEEAISTSAIDPSEVTHEDEIFDWPYACLTAENPQVVYEPEINPKEFPYFPSFQHLQYPKEVQIKLVNRTHCGYSDGAFNLEVIKNDKVIRIFTYIAGGLRFNNISPDNSSMIFTGTKSPETGNLNKETFMYDFVKDNLVILQSSRCTNDRYYWIDNDHFASFITYTENPFMTQDTEICVFTKQGELQRVLKTKMNFFMAYPGGLMFSGDIKFLNSKLILLYPSTKKDKPVLKIDIEEENGKFKEIILIEKDYTLHHKVGEILENSYRDKNYLFLDLKINGSVIDSLL